MPIHGNLPVKVVPAVYINLIAILNPIAGRLPADRKPCQSEHGVLPISVCYPDFKINHWPCR
jgi:hypothetical protein